MAITLLELRNRCKEQSDLENNEFIEDSEWDFLINESYKGLYDLLVTTWENYFINTSSATVTSGNNTIALPADFYKLKGIDVLLDSGSTRWAPITRFNFQERYLYQDSYSYSLALQPRVQYILMGDEIILQPVDNAAGSYTVWYVPNVTELTDDADTLNTVCDVYKQYIIADVCIKANAKQESDTTEFEKMKAYEISRIQKAATQRDSANTGRVSDMQDTDDAYYWLYRRR